MRHFAVNLTAIQVNTLFTQGSLSVTIANVTNVANVANVEDNDMYVYLINTKFPQSGNFSRQNILTDIIFVLVLAGNRLNKAKFFYEAKICLATS